MGRLPHPLGKTRGGPPKWYYIVDIDSHKLQNALLLARAVQPQEHTPEQHIIIGHMVKHSKTVACAANPPMFMIPRGTLKDLADMMQVWTLNEFACPAAIRQMPREA